MLFKLFFLNSELTSILVFISSSFNFSLTKKILGVYSLFLEFIKSLIFKSLTKEFIFSSFKSSGVLYKQKEEINKFNKNKLLFLFPL